MRETSTLVVEHVDATRLPKFCIQQVSSNQGQIRLTTAPDPKQANGVSRPSVGEVFAIAYESAQKIWWAVIRRHIRFGHGQT